mgnify:CR=1 FL=1
MVWVYSLVVKICSFHLRRSPHCVVFPLSVSSAHPLFPLRHKTLSLPAFSVVLLVLSALAWLVYGVVLLADAADVHFPSSKTLFAFVWGAYPVLYTLAFLVFQLKDNKWTFSRRVAPLAIFSLLLDVTYVVLMFVFLPAYVAGSVVGAVAFLVLLLLYVSQYKNIGLPCPLPPFVLPPLPWFQVPPPI